MAKTALPTASDVTAILANLPTPITIPSGYDLQDQVDAAVIEWNERTRYLPFFVADDATDQTIRFDPPGPNVSGFSRGGETKMLLKNGLISCTSIRNAVYQGQAGNLLVLGTDYFLGPSDAPAKGQPYTKIEFVYPQWGPPQSIQIVGLWGYAQGTIPDDAWQAILKLACSFVVADALQGMLSQWTSIKDDDQSVSRESYIRDLGESWARFAERVAKRYKLWN